MKLLVEGVTLQCVQGDITRQSDISAIVNAANAQLAPGGGVAGAIHAAAGLDLAKACRAFAPIHPGQAVITKGYRLENDYIIHCLGPVFGRDEPADELLANCYKEALALADQHRIASVAFPAIATGAFGYPFEDAAEVASVAVVDASLRLKHVRHVRFVFHEPAGMNIFPKYLIRAVARLNEAKFAET
jgi:O-acetyl-ADP-ribose deacetylase